jgi:hypothetical protein
MPDVYLYVNSHFEFYIHFQSLTTHVEPSNFAWRYGRVLMFTLRYYPYTLYIFEVL